MIQFLKNLGLMGAMLLVIANGTGPWSLDSKSVPVNKESVGCVELGSLSRGRVRRTIGCADGSRSEITPDPPFARANREGGSLKFAERL